MNKSVVFGLKKRIVMRILDHLDRIGVLSDVSKEKEGDVIQAILHDELQRYLILTEEQFEAQSTKGYKLGICTGLEMAAIQMRGLSGEAFSRGDDARAKILRDRADFFAKWHDEERTKYDNEFPKEVE